MRLLLPILALGAIALSGCANSGNVSPLVFCDRPSDFGAKVFTDCTPRVGGDSPYRNERDSRRYGDDRKIIIGGVYGG